MSSSTIPSTSTQGIERQSESFDPVAIEFEPTLKGRTASHRTLVIRGADEQVVRLKVDVLKRVASVIDLVVEERNHSKWRALVEALTPDLEFSPNKIVEAGMVAKARAAILNSKDFVTASQIAQAANFSKKNPSSQPNRWKRNGQIFAIEYKGTDLYPLYALDLESSFKPLPIVADILQLFTDKDSWQIAFWFGSLNSYLDDKMPKDLLLSDPQSVLRAAEDEAAGLQHG